MAGLSLFKLSKNPKVGESNIRISNRNSGLTPLEPAKTPVPSRLRVTLYLVLMFVVLVPSFFALFTTIQAPGFELKRFLSGYVFFPLPLMVLFFSIYLPHRELQRRRDALQANEWEPETLEYAPAFPEDRTCEVDVPSYSIIACGFVLSFPVFWFSAFLFGEYFSKLNAVDLVFAVLFFSLSWLYPIKLMKQRKFAIEVNDWEPKVIPRKAHLNQEEE